MKRIIAFFMLAIMAFNSLALPPGYPVKSTNSEEAGLLENKPADAGNIDFKQYGMGKAGQYASDAIQGWLGQFGTAKVELSGGNGFQSGSLDMLVPIYDSEHHLFFTQIGVRRSNLMTPTYRSTVNIGAGYRYFTDDNWMYGANVFYDRDVTRKHHRAGIGAEAWTDYLKLSANGYLRMSGWKTSPDLVSYDERPANGFDLRAEGYLPSYPQLGGKLMFEQYFGDEVGLFGVAGRSKNPSAVTIGAIWSPIPILNLGIDHRMGQGGETDTSFKIAFNYAIGVPLNDQLRSDNVAEKRKLKWSRYNLVERNNEIVLEYKKKPTGEIKLPASISGNPAAILNFPVTIVSDTALKNFSWTGSAASFAQPFTAGLGSITLPNYAAAGVNDYQLQLLAADASGRQVKSNAMTVTVTPLAIVVARSKASAAADGVDTVTFTATLLDTAQQPMPNKAIAWTVRQAVLQHSTNTTDGNGQAIAVVASTNSAMAEVDAVDASSGAKATGQAAFTGDPATARVTSFAPSITSGPADGSAPITLTAMVQDINGNAVGAGIPVSWATTIGNLAAASTLTDATGKATVVLTSPVTVGTANLTAKAAVGDPGKTATVTFVADSVTARVLTLTPSIGTLAATGATTATLTAQVIDANGNTVGAGVPVTWSSSLGSLAGATSSTDASGKATMLLTTGTTAGTANLTAKAATGDAGKTASVLFTGDPTTARVISFLTTPTSGPADGVSPIMLTAMVRDVNGNAVGAGVSVSWSASLGSLAAASSVTDASGKAIVTLTSPVTTGTSNLTAKAAAGDAGKTASVLFVPDTASARVTLLTSDATSATAGLATAITLTATVQDSHGNNVGASVAVQWAASLGNLSGVTSLTDTNGQATIKLTPGTAAGTSNLSAKASAGDPGKTASVQFVADAATARVISLLPTPATNPANGTAVSTLTAIVQDANGNAVSAGISVNWSTSLGTLAGASSLTNASGQATTTLTAPVTLGTANLTAKIGNGDPGKTGSVQFVPDAANARVVVFTVDSASVTAGSGTPITLSATVQDLQGNAIGAGVTVNWTASLGSLASASSVTDASGKVTAVLTPGTVAGTSNLSAKAAVGDPGKSASVLFVADPTTAKVVTLNGTPSSAPANGSAVISLTASVQDANGNPVGSGVAVNWATTLGNLSGSMSLTNASSQASMSLVAPGTIGTATVSAKGVAGDVGKTTAVTFVSPAVTRYDSGNFFEFTYNVACTSAPASNPAIGVIVWDGVVVNFNGVEFTPIVIGGYSYRGGNKMSDVLVDLDAADCNEYTHEARYEIIRTPV